VTGHLGGTPSAGRSDRCVVFAMSHLHERTISCCSPTSAGKGTFMSAYVCALLPRVTGPEFSKSHSISSP
jgi:hypothetical protein